MDKYVIHTNNLSKKYKSVFAVNSLNLSIRQGEIYGLIGQNGAGKTTLIRMLMGLTYPTSGEIVLWGKSDEKHLLKARTENWLNY
jgi:ABC-2 type transport system ATP-binding protein